MKRQAMAHKGCKMRDNSGREIKLKCKESRVSNNRELDKSRYNLSSFFLLFLISPFIISSIQLLHKWALVAMDMSNGSPVLLDGAQ